MLRYLAAFGLASVMDLQNWSGLTRMASVFAGLAPRLVRFRDERGRFDLPTRRAPTLTSAPVRFLRFDNIR